MSDESTAGDAIADETGGAAAAFDPETHRRDSLEEWEGAAPGWERRQSQMREFSRPVSEWLLDALDLQPGEDVLDIAAGIGETGLLAAQQVGAHGSVILADHAEAMLAAARRRADQLQVRNVETKCLNAESLDLEVGSLDAILCRWGFMLMADPDAALRECRRVLRPGGRIALAVWDSPPRNPWAWGPAAALLERGLISAPPSQPGGFRPSMFALADRDALAERIEQAGFVDVSVDSVRLVRRHASFEDFWEVTLDVSPSFHNATMSVSAQEIAEVKAAVEAGLAEFIAAGGAVELPAASLVAHACA